MDVKILLVDDEKGILNVLKICLQDAQYQVFTADNATRAVSMLEQQAFDIVITDIRMPGMDGISLLKHIKKEYSDTEVIMLTGHGDYKLAIESLKLDAVDFISKPIDNDILDIALKRANDRIHARNEILKYTKNLETLVEKKTRKLVESENKYSQLFNESPSYITIQDKDLNIVETNRIFTEHFNYAKGQTCFEVYKGTDSPCPDCPVLKTFKDAVSNTAEMQVRLKDGSQRNIFIQTSALKDADGNIKHVMEMSTDVTIIHELQDHLAALGLHIGSVSHGLKQLLTGLDGGSYLIDSGLKKKDIPQIAEGWQIVKEKISETRNMVLNILFHTKNRKPEPAPVPLKRLLKEIEETIGPKASKENVTLEITSGPADTILHIDKNAIFFALISILENAVDACVEKNGNGHILFEARTQKKNIIFTIQDNGTGIKEKDKIFNLFYSNKGNKGTGLGLFIAQRSIKQHGGNIIVDTRLGEYSRFTITLPCKFDAQAY